VASVCLDGTLKLAPADGSAIQIESAGAKDGSLQLARVRRW